MLFTVSKPEISKYHEVKNMKVNQCGLLSTPTHFLTLASVITSIYLTHISQVVKFKLFPLHQMRKVDMGQWPETARGGIKN